MNRPQTLALLLWLACLALLPFGRSAELPMAIAAVLGLATLIRHASFRRDPAVHLASLMFLGYWLPELCSAFDAVDSARTWKEVWVDLRYLPMLCYFTYRLREPATLQWALNGVAALVGLWTLDALVQAATGWSLGGAVSHDRLSGVFGAEDLKLGPALAVLSPFLLVAALQRGRWFAALALLLVGCAVLLAGTRSGWVMLGLVITVLGLREFGWHRGMRVIATSAFAALLLAILAFHTYAPFAERIERSAQVLSGDRDGVDNALAFRLPIWSVAVEMIAANPLNGVGVRGFRRAYAEYAEPDDRWLNFSGADQGAAHPHQLLLEILADTGSIGLLCWLLATWLAIRCRQRARNRHRPTSRAAGLALLAMLFPLNTHYAVYSSAWGGVLLVLLALWLAALHAPEPGTTEQPVQ